MAEMTNAAGTALERAGPGLKASVERVIAAGPMARIEQHPQWVLLSRLPMRMAVGVKVPHFKVHQLLALCAGQMIMSAWATSEDLPVQVGEVQLGWGEIEVIDQKMAIRLTRLT